MTDNNDDGINAADYVREIMHSARRRAGFEFVERKTATCESHGDFEFDQFVDRAGVLTTGTCLACHHEQTERDEKVGRALQEAEWRQAQITKRFESACIPPRFKDRTLDNYDTHSDKQKAVLDFCKAYASGFEEVMKQGSSIILSGTVGTGKTHLSIGIANAIMASGHTALFSTAAGIVRRVRATWGKNDEDEMEAMRIFINPDLLIVDEVGVQSGSDNEHQIIFEILNRRYENCDPTILLTNLPLQDQIENGVTRKGLKSFIGERLLDRMREGGGKAFTLDWKSGRIGR